jgi:hypothetical protein
MSFRLLLALVVAAHLYACCRAEDAVPTDFGGLLWWNADGSCTRVNPYTGTCGCLPGTLADTGFTHPSDNRSATVLCYGPTPGAFQGAYLRHRTGACLTPNKFTGQCTCPKTTSASEEYLAFNDADYPVTFCYGSAASALFGGVMGSAANCSNPFAGPGSPCTCGSSTTSPFSAITNVCTATCSAIQDAKTCQMLNVSLCGWCPAVNTSSGTGTCYATGIDPPYNTIPNYCCADGSVFITCSPEDGEFWSCCSEPGSFCCSGVDAYAQCCGPSYCEPNETPQCGDVENAWCECI